MISSDTHVSGEPAAAEAALSEKDENSLQTQVPEVSPGSASQAAFLKAEDLGLLWSLPSVLFPKLLCPLTSAWPWLARGTLARGLKCSALGNGLALH